jgi:hypothetical protein
MKLRHAAALALFISLLCHGLCACSPDMNAINNSSKRAEDATLRAEMAAKKAEYYADQAKSLSKKSNDAIAGAQSDERRAEDAVSRLTPSLPPETIP